MNIWDVKKEALANAAKNKSSEQVSLVLPSKVNTFFQVSDQELRLMTNPDYHEVRKVTHPDEHHKMVPECGSYQQNNMALIENEWRGVEERVDTKMNKLLEVKMVETFQEIKMFSERMKEGKSSQLQCSSMTDKDRRLIGKLNQKTYKKDKTKFQKTYNRTIYISSTSDEE